MDVPNRHDMNGGHIVNGGDLANVLGGWSGF
jgi:hypothetical protein